MSNKRKAVVTTAKYILLIIVGIIMTYPLIWMVSASFKTNSEIFTSLGLIPQNPTLSGYKEAMKGYGGDINIFTAMFNTYKFVIPKVIFTVASCTVAAYGFSRFDFKGRRFFFSIVMATLLLPNVVLNVPQFVMFNNWGWIDSPWYLPLLAASLFAQDTYFVFMINQFMRNIPRELDEAARIDGCTDMGILVRILMPVLKPAMISAALFQFMWSTNDFMGPLLYVSTPKRYPASIFIKMSMDADAGFSWNRILALSFISMIPSIIIFFMAQDSFVEGVTAGSVKG